jgi:ketosteroid isomerase-like protein
MTETESMNLAVVRRTLAGYGRDPLGVWLRDYAPDFTYEAPGFSGQVVGRDAMAASLANLVASHPDLTFVTRSILVSGMNVGVEGEVRYFENGRVRTFQQALFYTVLDNKIRSLRVYTQER